jgi:hypothetical protein
MTIAQVIKRIPVAGPVLVRLKRAFEGATFPGSARYWEERYRSGGNSGAGSYGRLADYKAEVINSIVKERSVRSVIEFGVGDGSQLGRAEYPEFHGFDVSRSALDRCAAEYSDRQNYRFSHVDEFVDQQADLVLSLDVVYHLVEDDTFARYMVNLFNASERLVVIYAHNAEDPEFDTVHVKTRKFTEWIEQNRSDFDLIRHIPNRYPHDPADPDNTSFADFYIFEKR